MSVDDPDVRDNSDDYKGKEGSQIDEWNEMAIKQLFITNYLSIKQCNQHENCQIYIYIKKYCLKSVT